MVMLLNIKYPVGRLKQPNYSCRFILPGNLACKSMIWLTGLLLIVL